jgi:UDP-N-acetylglucosamine 2-epimerase
VFDNLIDHRDYSLAYADDKPPFSPDYSERRKKILVAAHIFKDAPASHESGFHGFKHWLYEVLSALKSHQDKCVIYLKEHPSIDIYSEQGVLEGFLNTLQLNYPVTFISSKYATKLDDYDLVLTCSGSICYECAYLGVPVMSCSRSFSSKLSLNNPTHKIYDIELTSYQYKILAQHLIYRNIANMGLSIGDAKMHAMIQVDEIDIDAIAEKFLKALQGFYEQRNKPGVTLLSADLSRIEVLECQG